MILSVLDKNNKYAHKVVKGSFFQRLMEWYEENIMMRNEDNGTIFNLHPNSANRIIKNWSRAVGIKKKITFESLRNTTVLEVYTGNNGYMQKAKVDSQATYFIDELRDTRTIEERLENMSKEDIIKLIGDLDEQTKRNIIRKM